MDREEECACCHEIEQVSNKNQEVNEKIKPARPFTCTTDNPGFHTVCLDIWVLQAAWFGYKQQYGSRAYEGPEHKVNRHIAYRQLVRWCWGVIGKEIRILQAMKMTLSLLDFVFLMNNFIVSISKI